MTVPKEEMSVKTIAQMDNAWQWKCFGNSHSQSEMKCGLNGVPRFLKVQ
jgi:hypothetical protein